MNTIHVTTATVNGRTFVFRENADLSDFREDALERWEFDSRPVDTLSLIKTLDGCEVEPASPAYRLAYAQAFARVHCEAVRGPKPDLGSVPPAVLTAYVARADNSRGLSEEEFESLKKPKAPQTPAGPGSEGAAEITAIGSVSGS